jgi:hypothetical protein
MHPHMIEELVTAHMAQRRRAAAQARLAQAVTVTRRHGDHRNLVRWRLPRALRRPTSVSSARLPEPEAAGDPA